MSAKRAIGALSAALFVCAALVVPCACHKSDLPRRTFELRPVAATEIAKLEKIVVLPPPIAPPKGADGVHLGEIVRDLAGARGRMRSAMMADLAEAGAGVIPVAEAIIEDTQAAPEVKSAAVEVLGAIDDPRAADALAKRVDLEKYRDPSLRAQAAYQLVKQSSDHFLPNLIAQLKYETDGETVIAIAAVLAKHKNFAGLDGLRVLSTSGATPEVRADAQATLAQITKDAGFDDSETLYATWWSADRDRRLPREEPSPRLRLETWRSVARLSEFDLRLVDDARFSLSRGSPWVVDVLTEALHEKETHARLHVMQCLERMGDRAESACSKLASALDESSTAAEAATALGAVRCQEAFGVLASCTSVSHDPELRSAAAKALGQLGGVRASDALRPLVSSSEPTDLRETAAQALLACGSSGDAIPVLIECLTSPSADQAAAESGLESWLNDAASRGDADAKRALVQWKAHAEAGAGSSDDAHERRARRAQVLHTMLSTRTGKAR